MSSALYNQAKLNFMEGNLNLASGSIYVALMTASYTPNLTTDTHFGDINANEVSGTGYTAGGQALTSLSVTADNVNVRSIFTAANASWSSSTLSNVRYAVIYQNSGTPSTSLLVGYVDFGTAQATSASTFYIQWNALGIFSLT